MSHATFFDQSEDRDVSRNGINKEEKPEVTIYKWFIQRKQEIFTTALCENWKWFFSLSVLRVSVGIRFERVQVDDTFVEDESVLFGAGSHFQAFGGWIAGEEVRIDDVDVSLVVERIRQLF